MTHIHSSPQHAGFGAPGPLALYRPGGRRQSPGHQKLPDPENRASADTADQRLLCRRCRHPITTPVHRIHKQGRHEHVFFNPHGLVFEIGCFSQAPGCAVLGRPTLEFTWFSGFAWRITICRGCQQHLGWRYEQGEEIFFGLLTAQLILESPSSDPA